MRPCHPFWNFPTGTGNNKHGTLLAFHLIFRLPQNSPQLCLYVTKSLLFADSTLTPVPYSVLPVVRVLLLPVRLPHKPAALARPLPPLLELSLHLHLTLPRPRVAADLVCSPKWQRRREASLREASSAMEYQVCFSVDEAVRLLHHLRSRPLRLLLRVAKFRPRVRADRHSSLESVDADMCTT